MWLLFACGSALFAGITSILAKCGIRKTDSNLATAIRTGVVLAFAWGMVFLTGAEKGLGFITPRTLLFLLLSGVATGASWLCYFRALQLGDVNKVVPIDKSSTVLTVAFAFLFLGEPAGTFQIIGVVLIAAGTYLMIEKKYTGPNKAKKQTYLIYAVFSALFASLTSIFGKIGIENVDSNLGTAIRTGVVLVMSLIVVWATATKKQKAPRCVNKKELLMICLSGVATGASWLCYYRALQTGSASVVVPIDKLSILITVAFSCWVLHERLTKKALLGLGLLTGGTLMMALL